MRLQRQLHPIATPDSRQEFWALLCPSPACSVRRPFFFLGVSAILARDILISILRRDLGGKLPLLRSFQRCLRRCRVRRRVQTEEIALAKIAKQNRKRKIF